jgi:hypothetical protein
MNLPGSVSFKGIARKDFHQNSSAMRKLVNLMHRWAVGSLRYEKLIYPLGARTERLQHGTSPTYVFRFLHPITLAHPAENFKLIDNQ